MAAALLLAGAIPGTANAATTRPARPPRACRMLVGSVTPGGNHTSTLLTATSPITSQVLRVRENIYPDGQVRLSGVMATDPDIPVYDSLVSGWVVMGSTMYQSGYRVELDGAVKPENIGLAPVGSGWGQMTAFETVRYYPPNPNNVYGVTNQYALRADGTLFRWTMAGNLWSNKQSAPGFAAVKTMALISQTPHLRHLPGHHPRRRALHDPDPADLADEADREAGAQVHLAGLRDAHHRASAASTGRVLLGIDKDTSLRLPVRRRPRERHGHGDQGPRQGARHLHRPGLLQARPAPERRTDVVRRITQLPPRRTHQVQ